MTVTVVFRKTNCTTLEMAHFLLPVLSAHFSRITLMNREKIPRAHSMKYKLFCPDATNHSAWLRWKAQCNLLLCAPSHKQQTKISDLVFSGWRVKGN